MIQGLTIYNGVRLQCDGSTLWATQKEIASLFGVERSVITKHIQNIFASGELQEASVCAPHAHTATDGKTYQTNLYNLELIIAVGFCVSSRKGIRFRQWANKVLQNHLIDVARGRGYKQKPETSGKPIESLPATSSSSAHTSTQTGRLAPSGGVQNAPRAPEETLPEITIHCADCRDIMASMADESIDCIITDPPYKLSPSRGFRGGFMGQPRGARGNVFENADVSPNDFFREFYRLLKAGGHCYVMSNNLNLPTFLNAGIVAGFHFIKSIIWKKGINICGRYYMSTYEHILFYCKPGRERDINECSTPDILDVPIRKKKDIDGNNIHDTEKPVELMEILVRNSTNVGETVIDPFAGIGATLVACQNLKRHAIGCEINQHYCDIIKQRLQKIL